jgi:hypothetical protein
MFECFSKGAIKTIMLVQEEVRRLGSDYRRKPYNYVGLAAIAIKNRTQGSQDSWCKPRNMRKRGTTSNAIY